jgi:hypothetical protein
MFVVGVHDGLQAREEHGTLGRRSVARTFSIAPPAHLLDEDVVREQPASLDERDPF